MYYHPGSDEDDEEEQEEEAEESAEEAEEEDYQDDDDDGDSDYKEEKTSRKKKGAKKKATTKKKPPKKKALAPSSPPPPPKRQRTAPSSSSSSSSSGLSDAIRIAEEILHRRKKSSSFSSSSIVQDLVNEILAEEEANLPSSPPARSVSSIMVPSPLKLSRERDQIAQSPAKRRSNFVTEELERTKKEEAEDECDPERTPQTPESKHSFLETTDESTLRHSPIPYLEEFENEKEPKQQQRQVKPRAKGKEDDENNNAAKDGHSSCPPLKHVSSSVQRLAQEMMDEEENNNHSIASPKKREETSHLSSPSSHSSPLNSLSLSHSSNATPCSCSCSSSDTSAVSSSSPLSSSSSVLSSALSSPSSSKIPARTLSPYDLLSSSLTSLSSSTYTSSSTSTSSSASVCPSTALDFLTTCSSSLSTSSSNTSTISSVSSLAVPIMLGKQTTLGSFFSLPSGKSSVSPSKLAPPSSPSKLALSPSKTSSSASSPPLSSSLSAQRKLPFASEENNEVENKEKTSATTIKPLMLRPPPKKTGKAMELKSSVAVPNLNKGFTDIFLQLAETEKASGQRHKAAAYYKAITVLKSHTKAIESGAEAMQLPGVGKKIAAKIDEILATGDLQKLKANQEDPKLAAVTLLNRVTGIGPAKAQELYFTHNITDLEALRKNTHLLNAYQKVGLKYFEEFQSKIPREEMTQLERCLLEIANECHPDLLLTTCGSYRRGAEVSGDIDVLVTMKNWETGRGKPKVMDQFVTLLRRKGFFTDDLGDGAKKYSGVCVLPPSYHLPSETSAVLEEKDYASSASSAAAPRRLHRRIDLRFIAYPQYYAGILYFTGSDLFNKEMRIQGLKLGKHLSEYGVYVKTENGDVYSKVNSEEDIFKELQLDYVPPTGRNL